MDASPHVEQYPGGPRFDSRHGRWPVTSELGLYPNYRRRGALQFGGHRFEITCHPDSMSFALSGVFGIDDRRGVLDCAVSPDLDRRPASCRRGAKPFVQNGARTQLVLASFTTRFRVLTTKKPTAVSLEAHYEEIKPAFVGWALSSEFATRAVASIVGVVHEKPAQGATRLERRGDSPLCTIARYRFDRSSKR